MYSVSGRVTVGTTGLSVVVVKLSGARTLTAITNSLGNYTFANLPLGGNFTVTPSKLGYVFTPGSRTFTNLNANQGTANFSAMARNYTISGRIMGINNQGISGVTMTLSGSRAATATTNSTGLYSFTGLPAGGNFTVRPSKAGMSFAPVFKTFNSLSANQTATTASFQALCSISGLVRNPNGTGRAGVVIALSGSRVATVTTANNGSYSFANLPAGGTYTVKPKPWSLGVGFNPESRTFTKLITNQTSTTASFKIYYFDPRP